MIKTFRHIVAILILSSVSVVAILANTSETPGRKPAAIKYPAFALMELFTSQGCSSCPPADAIAAAYAVKNDDNIIPLVFHVDYWNRLGWVDSFSNSAYSQRQKDYAEKFNLESIYTPQLVVNGKKQLVGSDKNEIDGIVRDMLKEPAKANIEIYPVTVEQNKIMIRYNISESLPGATVHAALVQKNAMTHIRSGENRGLKLNNCNVVRDFKSHTLKKEDGGFVLNLPAGNQTSDYFIAVFVQDNSTGNILAAVKVNCN